MLDVGGETGVRAIQHLTDVFLKDNQDPNGSHEFRVCFSELFFLKQQLIVIKRVLIADNVRRFEDEVQVARVFLIKQVKQR